MNKREAKKFEKQLLAERERLGADLRQIEEETLGENAGPVGQDVASFAEVGTDNFERETALKVASNEAEAIRDIDDALRRIKDGVFGVCEGCNEEIARRRIEVFPAARYCISCKEKLERDGYL